MSSDDPYLCTGVAKIHDSPANPASDTPNQKTTSRRYNDELQPASGTVTVNGADVVVVVTGPLTSCTVVASG